MTPLQQYWKPVLASILLAVPVQAQGLLPVICEAEAASLGVDWSTGTDGSITYVTIGTDLVSGDYPGNAVRVGEVSVTFPETGDWQLYARVYVGSDPGNDDSFYYGSSMGPKDPSTGSDWITVNQLSGAFGYTSGSDYVLNGGLAGSETWKWINLSRFTQTEPGTTFTVTAAGSPMTFAFGGREDGLRIDKFAFGRKGVYFTVYDLENGTAGATEDPSTGFQPVGPPIADGKVKYLGCAHGNSQAGGDLEDDFLAYFNQIVPENGGKWGSVEGTRDVMNWGALDTAYNLAKDNGLPFRFHVLVWGSQQPGWLENLSEEELLEELIEWFDAVAERYPDIDYLEVVNEPINQPPDKPEHGVYMDALGGAGDTGFDWVITAFELARERFPDAALVLNEYGVLDAGSRTTQYIGLASLLIERGLLDVIGVQGHAFETTSQYGHSVAEMTADLDRLGATGLPVIITEMDVDGVTGDALDDSRQLLEYQRIFPMFWEHPSVIGVTLWGYRPGMWRSEQGAYLVLDTGAERPAMQWLQSYVSGTELPHWMGKYPILNYWVDTGDWLGLVNIRKAPWYWTESGWLYGDANPQPGNGMWLYFHK